jgi:hypothetical protein
VTTIIIGSNRFVDCGSIIRLGASDIVRVQPDPLRLDFDVPAFENRGAFAVKENVAQTEGLRVIAGPSTTSLFLGEFALVAATQLATDIIHLHLDLRPIGLNIFDDGKTLFVGPMQFTESGMQGAACAVQLGPPGP